MPPLSRVKFHSIIKNAPKMVATFEVVETINFRDKEILPGTTLWTNGDGLRIIGEHRGNIIPLVPKKIKFEGYRTQDEIDLLERLSR